MDENIKKEDLDKLEEKLLLCEKERDEYLNGWKRAKADLINGKKEWAEKIGSLADFITVDVSRKFLPVLDAMDVGEDIEGLKEVKKLFWDTLKKMGVEEIEALGKKFDPAYHESVSEGDGNSGEVTEVLQKGYIFKGQVIRAARVKIGV